ncbi:SDR family oxidoreductase [Falsigemmobacter faecalis]|uniref:hypothetical protein n=1 Tax=Falsigemmobacter faecalis TaxID=2488730 RepID=UPI001F3B5E52|nr:hypothetical protein [Falsigemmobacter faecalis]
MGDAAGMEGTLARIEPEVGPVAVLMNNSGGPKPSSVSGQPAVLWRGSFEGMVLSVMPGMKAAGGGRATSSPGRGGPDHEPWAFRCAADLVQDPDA